MEGWRATRYFAEGEYLHALRLTSELVDLRAADANQIPCRGAARSRSDGGWIAYPKEKHPKMGCFSFGGATRNRTGDEGFADLCLTAWLWRHEMKDERGGGTETGKGTSLKKADANVCDSHPQFWSGLRGSNPPPRPWQGRALPNELNPHKVNRVYLIVQTLRWCLRSESNQRHGDFQSPALPTELQRQINGDAEGT